METLQRAARPFGIEGPGRRLTGAEIVEQCAGDGGLADAPLVGTDENDSWFGHGTPWIRVTDGIGGGLHTSPLSQCKRSGTVILISSLTGRFSLGPDANPAGDCFGSRPLRLADRALTRIHPFACHRALRAWVDGTLVSANRAEAATSKRRRAARKKFGA